MSHHLKQVLLVGAGQMAVHYARVLHALNISFTCVGRGTSSANAFRKQTGCLVHTGGLNKYVNQQRSLPHFAIVAVNVEQLASTTLALLKQGVRHILIEKPGGLHAAEIGKVAQESRKQKAKVYVAYNRRFYASTMRAQQIIAEDDGVQSFHFEFTELSHQIATANYARQVKQNWFLANSSHVIDMAFYLGGEAQSISCYTTGSLPWHPAGSVFSGSGMTKDRALFSYHANWHAPGRWGIELMTAKRRLIIRPLEELYVQQIGSFTSEKVCLNDWLDAQFKPGLYRLVRAFLHSTHENDLLSIEDHYGKSVPLYTRMLKLD